MDKFTVPQFIENEDKIVAFLSVRQFLIIGVAFAIIFVLYKLLGTIAFVLSATIVGVAAGILAFYKVNGQPFHFFLLNVFQTNRRPGLRVWKKEVSKKEWEAQEQAMADKMEREAQQRQAGILPEKHEPSARRLSELSLIVDTGGAYQGDTAEGKELF
ncbi:MAG: PrgI family protein [Patescibacteria group bacterium]